MRVEVSPTVVTAPEALWPLTDLLRCFVSDRHEWAATPQAAQALHEFFERNGQAFAEIVLDLGRKTMVNAAWSAPGCDRQVRVDADNVADTVHDLCRDAVLVVEDLATDGAFVQAVAAVFGAGRVVSALREKWLVIRHSGGTGRLPMVARTEGQAFRRLIRVAVLVDSDRLLPGQRTGSHDKADELRAEGLTVHVLRLREAENYVPNRVLAHSGDRASATARLNRLKALRPEQRDHFDMKHGFGRRNEPPKIPRQQATLFADLPNPVRNDLRGGFGDRLLPLLNERRDELTVRDFATLGAHVEADLRALLSTIESVI